MEIFELRDLLCLFDDINFSGIKLDETKTNNPV